MVRTFNGLSAEYKGMPYIQGTDEERFALLKIKLRQKCQWDRLGLPIDWPESVEDALLDIGDDIYRYGQLADTTSEEEEEEEAGMTS